jgi:hypothetical protein
MLRLLRSLFTANPQGRRYSPYRVTRQLLEPGGDYIGFETVNTNGLPRLGIGSS